MLKRLFYVNLGLAIINLGFYLSTGETISLVAAGISFISASLCYIGAP